MKTLTIQEIIAVHGGMNNTEIAEVVGLTLIGAGLAGSAGFVATAVTTAIVGNLLGVTLTTALAVFKGPFVAASIAGGMVGGYFSYSYATNWVTGSTNAA